MDEFFHLLFDCFLLNYKDQIDKMLREEKMMEDIRNKTNVSTRSPVDGTCVEDHRFPKEKSMKSNCFDRFSFLYEKFCRNFK